MMNETETQQRPRRLGVLSLVSAVLAVTVMCGYGFWGAGLMLDGGSAALDRMNTIGNIVNVLALVLLVASIILGVLSVRKKDAGSGFGFAGLVLGGLSLLGYAALLMMWLSG